MNVTDDPLYFSTPEWQERSRAYREEHNVPDHWPLIVSLDGKTISHPISGPAAPRPVLDTSVSLDEDED